MYTSKFFPILTNRKSNLKKKKSNGKKLSNTIPNQEEVHVKNNLLLFYFYSLHFNNFKKNMYL